MNIKMLSYFKVNLDCNLIENYSDTLVVLLPGIGYTGDRPLMDYSKRLASEMRYDVLSIEYGFQVARTSLNHSDEFSIVIRETREIILKALNDKYRKIVFIGKSIGTLVQTSIEEKLAKYETFNIYLTPVSETIKVGIKESSLIIAGNNDPMINNDALHKLREMSNVKFLEIEGADHSLNIKNDTMKSIDVLKKVIEAERNYLNSIK